MLNFYNCIRLLAEATHCGLIQRDPNISDNILVYREAGEEDPEGWYSENLMSIVQELQDDEEGQTEILGALEEKTGQPFNEKPLPFPDTMRKDTYMQETTLRENLLVTFGSRAAYMDSMGKISLPSGLDGEDEIAAAAVDVVDRFLSNTAGDTSFDEFIETALNERLGEEAPV